MTDATGFLRKSDTGVVGYLKDPWGYVTEITGEPGTDADGNRGYVLRSRLTVIPDELQIPFLDTA